MPSLLHQLIGAVRHRIERRRNDRLYRNGDYLAAYRTDTDLRVEVDPHTAIGGMWEEIGQLQFDYLKSHGLQPHHRMLDVGCGTLRGGRHFIAYLEPGGYTGIDISPKAVEAGRQLVADEGLSQKRPNLVVSANMDLKFNEFAGSTFDFILAQSVFTHLKPEHIEECFAHVARVMHADSAFYFTYAEADTYTQRTAKDFSYPFTFFRELAERYGLSATAMGDYPHPRQQRMGRLSLAPAATPA